MKTINHICAIFIKQIKDSLKNRLVLVVFFMFPILALVFKEIVSEVELDFIYNDEYCNGTYYIYVKYCF